MSHHGICDRLPGICRGVDKKQISKWHNTGPKLLFGASESLPYTSIGFWISSFSFPVLLIWTTRLKKLSRTWLVENKIIHHHSWLQDLAYRWINYLIRSLCVLRPHFFYDVTNFTTTVVSKVHTTPHVCYNKRNFIYFLIWIKQPLFLRNVITRHYVSRLWQ